MCTKFLLIIRNNSFLQVLVRKEKKNLHKVENIILLIVDENFKWANTGAAVFGDTTRKADEDEGGSDEEVVHSDDIHFEPIVSLPEVR